MKELMRTNLTMTGINLFLGLLAGLVLAWLAAQVRGSVQPNGTLAHDGSTALWVGITFRRFAPWFIGGGAILGVLMAQVQFAVWARRRE